MWGPGGNDSRGHRKAHVPGGMLALSWPCAGAGTQVLGGLQPAGPVSVAALCLASLPPRRPGPGSAVHFPLHCLSVISISLSTLTNKRPRASGRNPPPSGEPPDMPGTACAHLRDTYWLAQVSVGFRLHFPDVVAVWKKGHGKSVTWCLTERIPRKHTPRSRRTARGQQPPSGGPTRPLGLVLAATRREQSRVCATVDGRQAQRGDLGDSHPDSGTGNLVEPKDLALQGSAWWWGGGLP